MQNSRAHNGFDPIYKYYLDNKSFGEQLSAAARRYKVYADGVALQLIYLLIVVPLIPDASESIV